MTQENGIMTPKRKDGIPALSPSSVKKRRVLEERSQNIETPLPPSTQTRGQKMSSQNIKSSFEEDLDRLTQEIGQVESSILLFVWLNAAPFETDQKWARPPVKPFDPATDALSTSSLFHFAYDSISTDRVRRRHGRRCAEYQTLRRQ